MHCQLSELGCKFVAYGVLLGGLLSDAYLGGLQYSSVEHSTVTINCANPKSYLTLNT